MQNSKIFQIIKKSGQAFVFNINHEQWISDGFVAYSLAGLPEFTEESLLCMLDKSSDDCFPISMNSRCDIDLHEDKRYEPEISTLQIRWQKKDYVFIKYDVNRGFFVNLKYINAFLGDFNYTFKVQENKKMRYLVIFDGMFPVCIVMPASIIDTGFENRVSEIASIVGVSMKDAVPTISGQSVVERTMIGTLQNVAVSVEQMEI